MTYVDSEDVKRWLTGLRVIQSLLSCGHTISDEQQVTLADSLKDIMRDMDIFTVTTPISEQVK